MVERVASPQALLCLRMANVGSVNSDIRFTAFVDTVASGASHEAIIEKIDIGGISLIRAAAKNYNDVVIVASKGQYKACLRTGRGLR